MPLPSPPEVGVFTRFVLESPWLVGVGLLVVAAVLAWRGLREGLTRQLMMSAVLGVLGVAVLATGHLVQTSGEHARVVVRALVDSVVAEDLTKADALLADHAVLSVGSPTNPGIDKAAIMSGLSRFTATYRVEDNSVTMLRGYSESEDAGVVHLACSTTVDSFPYPNVSTWVIRVERRPDGPWKIARLTCVEVNKQTPPLEQMR